MRAVPIRSHCLPTPFKSTESHITSSPVHLPRLTPPVSRWGQQRALKAALLAALGAACCIAFLRAGLPFRGQSTHADEDSFFQVIARLSSLVCAQPPTFPSPSPPLLFHVQPSPRSAPPLRTQPHISPFCPSSPLLPHLSVGFPACLRAHYLDHRRTRVVKRVAWRRMGGRSKCLLLFMHAFRANLPAICSTVCAAGRGGEDQGGYLVVQLAGGLNQMRAGVGGGLSTPRFPASFSCSLPPAPALTHICDAVVVAKLLGASLMLPLLDNSSWWADGSTFADVFDAGHFARVLAPWVRVVDRLPSALRHRPPLDRTVPRGSTAEYYETRVRAMIRKAQVLKLNHFDSRLHDDLPLHLQKLRCVANYEALHFVPAVTQAVTRLTHALTHPSATAATTALDPAAQAGGAAAAAQGTQGQRGEREQVEGGMQAKGNGGVVKYVAIHLRYEPDMLAFTGCEYEGGAEEKVLFESIRQRWANLPAMDAEKQRAKGMCIVTPSQVAVALQALGLPPSTRVYIASGALHGGAAALQPLLHAYPFTTDKHSLAHSHAMAHARTGGRDDDDDEGDEAWGAGGGGSREEGVRGEGGRALAGVEGRKTLLAAVDYEMCRGAALLVTNNNGNMAHLLAGHRRYNGVGGTVHLFGSSIHRLLAAIQHGDHEASQKLRNRLLKGDLSSERESNEKAAARGGFYAFPRDCAGVGEGELGAHMQVACAPHTAYSTRGEKGSQQLIRSENASCVP
ncbi:unnamed protein product [Closterium sp. NIES-65]|nr:unnamed protein product [Closterium sp. NIES-65]